MNTAIGKSIQRKEAWDKVTGSAKYTGDFPVAGDLYAWLLTSPHAHAYIRKFDIEDALAVQGVQAVVTGEDIKLQFGVLLADRPALAREKVRYAGEPVAIVVASDQATAMKAAGRIKVEYETIPFVLTPTEALKSGAPLIHENGKGYKRIFPDIYPEKGSNVASRYSIRKGQRSVMERAEVVVAQKFHLPPSDHMAMETRTARARINRDGTVIIETSSQSPYAIRSQLAEAFGIPSGNIQVNVPLVGGGFGGKAAVMPEILAYIASKSVGGKSVRLTLPREQDMETAPCRLGLDAEIRLGASRDGRLQAAEMTFLLDCGAYSDIAPYMTKSIAVDCTGPYNIENLFCDALCVYTNHTYATSYRGFGHEAYTFCMERTLDILANHCGIDPWEIRRINAIKPGDLTPSSVECTSSNVGNVAACLEKIKATSDWTGQLEKIKPDTVKAMGIACGWKTANPPTDAISGALLTFNDDGSLNLNTGVVEMGSASQTNLSQIVAEKLKIDAGQVHVVLPVDTRTAPEHYKTVASMTEYMAGRAALRAAEDLIVQLQKNGSQIFSVEPEQVEVAYGRVYSKKNPDNYVLFKDIVRGYKSKNGESIGEPVIGRGGFKLKGLSMLNPETGKGKPGPSWTPLVQVVEVEADLKHYTYRLLNAYTVIDVGKTINPEAMRASVAGGMAMGIGMAGREAFRYDEKGRLKTPTLRTYKLTHIGEEPIYHVDFVETPDEEAPYGARSYSEHGIIGAAAALGNALSSAFGIEADGLPLTPEALWKLGKGGQE